MDLYAVAEATGMDETFWKDHGIKRERSQGRVGHPMSNERQTFKH